MCAAGDSHFKTEYNDVLDFTILGGANQDQSVHSRRVRSEPLARKRKTGVKWRLLQVLGSSLDSCPLEGLSDVHSPSPAVLNSPHEFDPSHDLDPPQYSSTPAKTSTRPTITRSGVLHTPEVFKNTEATESATSRVASSDRLVNINDHESSLVTHSETTCCDDVTQRMLSRQNDVTGRGAAGLTTSHDLSRVMVKVRSNKTRDGVGRSGLAMGNSTAKHKNESKISSSKNVTADVTWFDDGTNTACHYEVDDSGTFSDVIRGSRLTNWIQPVRSDDSDVTARSSNSSNQEERVLTCEQVVKKRLQLRRRHLHFMVEQWFEKMMLRCDTMTSCAQKDL